MKKVLIVIFFVGCASNSTPDGGERIRGITIFYLGSIRESSIIETARNENRVEYLTYEIQNRTYVYRRPTLPEDRALRVRHDMADITRRLGGNAIILVSRETNFLQEETVAWFGSTEIRRMYATDFYFWPIILR